MSAFSSTKKIFIGGNWKCNVTLSQADAIIKIMNDGGDFPANAEVVIAVPSIHLIGVKSKIRPDISLSSQDVGINPGFGAYTGETSVAHLNDIGVNWAVIGHSERRVGFGYPGETNEVVGRKVKTSVSNSVKAIACIGEQLADRESGQTLSVVSAQLAAIASQLSPADWAHVVVAYEPVWAIGTGKVATPEQAEETHAQIRDWIKDHVSAEVAAEIRIIYGGSVKGSNAISLLAGPNIDGFLVGGASLLPEFVDIIKAAANRL